jgi:predicted ATPase
MARIIRGWADARDGRLESGIADMAEGIELWKATGFENWQPWYACLKAEAMARGGQGEEALAEIDHQLERIGRNSENQFRSLLLAEKASILGAKAGQREMSARLFDEAEAVAQAQGAEAWLRAIRQKRLGAPGKSFG